MATTKASAARQQAKLAAFGVNYGSTPMNVSMDVLVAGRIADALGLDPGDVLVCLERIVGGQVVVDNVEVRSILLGDPDEKRPLFSISRLAELDNGKLRLLWPRLAPKEKRAAVRTAFDLGGFDAAWALVSSTP